MEVFWQTTKKICHRCDKLCKEQQIFLKNKTNWQTLLWTKAYTTHQVFQSGYFLKYVGPRRTIFLCSLFKETQHKQDVLLPAAALRRHLEIFCRHNGSIRQRIANVTTSSRHGGGSMRYRLLFLTHFCCPATSPINQSGSQGQTGNESAYSLSAVWFCV